MFQYSVFLSRREGVGYLRNANLSDLKNFNSPLPVSWRGSMKTLFFPVLHVCSFVYLSREYIVRHGTLTFVRGTFPDFIVGQHDPCLI